ncbi:thiamine-triphosphatase [Alligator mississippiensis]|nr:thiamine-triphosphatase [Alligator mississippiensis]
MQEDVAEPTGSIEVEAKFMVGPGTEARLVVLGAVLAGAVSFQDQYYDTPDGRLTLADHWLRHREGAGWELKCPPWPAGGARDPGYGPGATSQDGSTRAATSLNPGAPAQPPGSTTAYQELTSPAAVVARLCAILAVAPDPGWACIPVAVAGLGLEVFAAFRTQRRSYRLGRLSVDLDEADFGYAVGEVETAVTHPWEVPAAQEEVTRVGRELGVEVTGPVMGKMSVYLQQYRPQHYEELVQAGRLVRDKMPMGGRD